MSLDEGNVTVADTNVERVQYDEYIQSEFWAIKVKAAKRSANYRCQICNRSEEETILDGHHRTYERLGKELPQDITILCRDCHELYTRHSRLAKFGHASIVKQKSPYPIKTVIKDLLGSVADGKSQALLSGFTMLDKLTGGISRSQLVVVTGRPSMGKSAFLNSLVLNVTTEHSTRVAYFSLQSAAAQVTRCLLSMATGINHVNLRSNRITEDEWPILLEASELVSNLPITLDDTPRLTTEEIRHKCYSIIKEQGALDFILIDGADRIATDTPHSSIERSTLQIARELKSIAAECNAVVIVTYPASADVEKRSDKRPVLANVLWPWTDVADLVLGMYREDYYVSDTDRENLAELFVMKNREGPLGVTYLFFRKELGHFRELEVQRRVYLEF